MLQSELIENGERIHHWSDMWLKIRQMETGIVYEDAVDVLPCQYTYEETNEPIIMTEEDEDNEKGGLRGERKIG